MATQTRRSASRSCVPSARGARPAPAADPDGRAGQRALCHDGAVAASTPSRIWYLRRLNLFDGMSAEEIEDVGRLLHDRRCEAGEQVWDPEGDRVYMLKAGRVRLFRTSEDGQGTTTPGPPPRQLFGLAGAPHPAGAR